MVRDDDIDDSGGGHVGRRRLTNPWWLRATIALIFLTALATIWTTNAWLTARFSENTRVRSELRLALYTGNLMSELQRNSVVPLLLARDPSLIEALNENVRRWHEATHILCISFIGAGAEGGSVSTTDMFLIGPEIPVRAAHRALREIR